MTEKENATAISAPTCDPMVNAEQKAVGMAPASIAMALLLYGISVGGYGLFSFFQFTGMLGIVLLGSLVIIWRYILEGSTAIRAVGLIPNLLLLYCLVHFYNEDARLFHWIWEAICFSLSIAAMILSYRISATIWLKREAAWKLAVASALTCPHCGGALASLSVSTCQHCGKAVSPKIHALKIDEDGTSILDNDDKAE